MRQTDVRFDGSIPAVYEEYLGPLLFSPYADDLAGRVRGLEEGTVLETAAGTGILTRSLARVLSSAVKIVATDLNEAMLQVAERKTSHPSITWRVADAQKLPLADGSVDALVCQFGMMFVPNKVAAYREAKRVLKPGGQMLFNVWDALLHNEMSLVVNEAVATEFPTDPPRFFERVPFGYHDTDVIRTELSEAGFATVEFERVSKTTVVPSAAHGAIGLCKGTPLRSEIQARAAERLEAITAAAGHALAARFGASAFDNRMRALVVVASR